MAICAWVLKIVNCRPSEGGVNNIIDRHFLHFASYIESWLEMTDNKEVDSFLVLFMMTVEIQYGKVLPKVH